MTTLENTELTEFRDGSSGGPDTVTQNSSDLPVAETEISSLPPTDHGRAAYLVLAGCTLIQAPVWGYSLAFGVFQEYYTTHNAVEGSKSSVATIGTSFTGIMYLMMPLTFTFLTRYPRARPYCGPIGLAISVGSTVLSAFATKVWQLIACQGVLCAIGNGLLFSPTTLYLDEWFILRKGLAYGVIWTGKSATGVAMPFIMSALLSSYGPRTTLLAWAITVFLITAPLLFFLKPRIPTASATARRPLSWTFLRHPTFWVLQLGNIGQSLGYFLPSTYLASYANQFGLSSSMGTLLLALFNFASMPGSLLIGMFNDRYAVTTSLLISSLGSAISVFIFWGLSSQMALLTVFMLTYGFFAGGFSSTYTGVVRQLVREDGGVDTGLIMGLLLGGRGIGNVVSGPISSALLSDEWSMNSKWGYDTQYGPIIVFTGATAVLGGWGWIWKCVKSIL